MFKNQPCQISSPPLIKEKWSNIRKSDLILRKSDISQPSGNIIQLNEGTWGKFQDTYSQAITSRIDQSTPAMTSRNDQSTQSVTSRNEQSPNLIENNIATNISSTRMIRSFISNKKSFSTFKANKPDGDYH